MTAIRVEGLSVHAGEQRLLGPVSFSLQAGVPLIIMGETGAGKSLIAQAIFGTLPAALRADGEIYLNDQRVDHQTHVERSQHWGRDLTILPQEPWRALNPLMAARKQVAEVHRQLRGLSRKAASQETAQDLSKLGLEAHESRLPSSLSGGMAQRVAYAAATAGRAPILLADEPTKGLDSDRQQRIVNLLREHTTTGGAVLTITHDVQVARALGGRLLVLRNGDVVEQGDTDAILAHPQADYTQALIAAHPSAWASTPRNAHGSLLLRTQGLAIGRSGQTLCHGIDLELHAGERLAVLGPSGIGKSTLLDTLAGLQTPISGHVERAPELHATAVQKLYQDPPAAFPSHGSLRVNLRDVAHHHGSDWQQVIDAMAALGLGDELLDRTPDSVSGGELQRLSLVRALLAQPKVILADEPTSRLDPITQQETLAHLATLAKQRGIGLLLVTHDRDMATAWAERTITLAAS